MIEMWISPDLKVSRFRESESANPRIQESKFRCLLTSLRDARLVLPCSGHRIMSRFSGCQVFPVRRKTSDPARSRPKCCLGTHPSTMAQTQTFAGTSGTPDTGAGLCLLSLDGGGIRGISSLLILQQLMEMINPDDPPKPCDYFDMIGGTSTGGLIAVMLGRLRMSVQEAYDEYIKLSPKIFSQLQHRLNWKFETQARYNSDAITDGVMEILKQKGMNESELLKDTSPKACRT